MAQRITTEDALALAKAGDADAQYALGSLLHQRGQFEESLHWLRLASAQRLVPARLALASLLMDGLRCSRDLPQALDLLEPLAASQVQARLLLAELHGFAGFGLSDRVAGLRHLAAAARMGHAGAMRQLALLGALHGQWDLTRPLFDAAARRGDGPAAFALARCHAEGIGGPPDPALAAAICQGAAARSQYLHARLVHRIGAPQAPSSVPPPAVVDWELVERSQPQLAAEPPLPAAETLSEQPLVRRLPAVIHPLVLDAVINLAAPLVRRSEIVDAATGEVRADPMRTSSHVTLGPRQHDHVLEALEACIGRVAGLPARNGEFLQVLRYRPGEEFRPHVDYFNEGGAGAYQSLADGGQRAQTVLTWLNDDYSGGSTRFPRLQLDVRAQPGDMLHFHNVGADRLGHRDSLHAGMPVQAGEKWLLSQWLRSEAYPARVAW